MSNTTFMGYNLMQICIIFVILFLQGGLSTKDEMCIGFLLYYPKIPLSKCTSAPTFQQFSKFLDGEGYETK